MVILLCTIGTIHKFQLLETRRISEHEYLIILNINTAPAVNAITNGNHCYPDNSDFTENKK